MPSEERDKKIGCVSVSHDGMAMTVAVGRRDSVAFRVSACVAAWVIASLA